MASVERSVQEKVFRGAVVTAVGLVIWFIAPPEGVTVQAWHLLAIFVGTICGLILQPLPMGAMVFLAVTLTALTHTLKPGEALNGFANPTVWLIVAAFLFARAFSISGFGRRIAFFMVKLFGKNTLGLGYALCMSDLVLSPSIPSGAARTGGVLYPVVRELCAAFKSEPGPTGRRIGEYLIQTTFHAHDVTCAMFMTSMAANPLIAELILKTTGTPVSWGTWALASIVPGLLSLAVLPLLLLKLLKPEIRHTPEAPILAREELTKLGPMSRNEIIVLCVFAMVLILWITGSINKINAAFVALLGISVLLLTGALKWQDVLMNTAGWDALVWFGGLVGMATMLGKLGLLKWFAGFVGAHVAGWSWMPTLLVVVLVYFYAHYFMASLTAHVTAMFVPLLTVAIAAGAPPVLASLVMAYFSNLCVCLTHYGGGPAPIYFGAGYTDVPRWWGVGFILSLLFIVIWLGVGSLYWKMLGLY